MLVDEAGDGKEAIDQVAAKLPHLILLDLTMPVMDGFLSSIACGACRMGRHPPSLS